MSIRSENAKQNFINGYNCAQSVFCACQDVTGLDELYAYCISSSFGGSGSQHDPGTAGFTCPKQRKGGFRSRRNGCSGPVRWACKKE